MNTCVATVREPPPAAFRTDPENDRFVPSVTAPMSPVAVETFPSRLDAVPSITALTVAVIAFPSAIVSVPCVPGSVIVMLLMLVAVATPSDGVVKTGDEIDGADDRTTEPEPVVANVSDGLSNSHRVLARL